MRPFASTLRGIAAIIAAQLVFLVNDTLNKLASARLPTGEVIFFRGVFATLLVGAVVVALGLHRKISLLRHRLVAARILGELGGTYFFLVALFHMPIGNAMVIFQAVPLSVTAGAALFFGEPVGWRRWAAVAIGFLGVVTVVRPGLAGFEVFGILVLVAVLFVAFRDLATYALPPAIPALVLSLVTGAAVTVMGAVMGVAEEWVVPSPIDLMETAGAGLFLTIGYVTSIVAMRYGDISVTASFRYVTVVFAIAVGFLVWGDVPDAATIIGSVIIVGAGLYTLHREHSLARKGGPLITAKATIDPAARG